MTPHAKYRAGSAVGWTRIDMLLALYRATTQALEAGAGDADATAVDPSLLARTQKLLLLLLDGLCDDVGEPVPAIRRLLLFALQQVQTRRPAGWTAARRIVGTLHDAFESIADEARLLERQGFLTTQLLPTAAAP